VNREDALRALLVEAAARGVAPRLDAAVWSEGELWTASTRAGPEGIFDLASLTKPLSTGLVMQVLIGEGRLTLDDHTFDGASLRQVLDHSAGYAAWAPLFKGCLDDVDARRVFMAGADRPFDRSRALMEEAASQTRPLAAAGAQDQYSDLGFLKLGLWLEQKLGTSMAELF
jgi:CubicO group peptidase (beta-lactamase class C family)